ncbi:MAG: asnB [Chthoniobacteraceae bacterium]|nr:asnB [Chthoniobacteraceae bacterium]
MCAIYGQLGFQYNAKTQADNATDMMAHRGPDARGTWHGANIFLGMRRLSVIDINGGHQPIWNESKTSCIVFNGEIYNFHELRRLLETKGHSFSTASDTEVILHAYDEWDVDCLRRLNGMFAIAIWDQKQKRLLIARDRIGEKPLYYYRKPNGVIFASEIKSILSHCDISREINPRGLSNFFAFGHSMAPETIYKGIFKLLPGHYILATEQSFDIKEYWDIGAEMQLLEYGKLSAADYGETILRLLDDSVRRRMIADVPVGAFLSGGVDSTAIVALMQRHASVPVKTFSLGFSIGGSYNELQDARAVAAHFDTEHHELLVEHVDLVETLRRLVYHYDEPFGDAACFPLYLLSNFAREHVKVVLSGDGGDELFGGYRRYAVDRLASRYQMLPNKLIDRLIPMLADRMPRLRRLKRTVHTLPLCSQAERYASWLVLFDPEMQSELLSTGSIAHEINYNPASITSPYIDRFHHSQGIGSANKMMYADLKTLLPDGYMEKTDKATMACSLEARLPILDHRLVELAFGIPDEFKIRGRSLKWIFKQALRRLVPPKVIARPKHGFAVPLDPWFRGELKEFAYDVILDERTRRRGYFDVTFVERLWREHKSGRNVWDSQLWLLLNFELWSRIYLDGDAL